MSYLLGIYNEVISSSCSHLFFFAIDFDVAFELVKVENINKLIAGFAQTKQKIQSTAIRANTKC